MKMKIIFILFFVHYFFCLGYDCKIRLPEHLNNYTLQILPIITFDSKYLYFDRKNHPENCGGLVDLDDIWFSELKNNKFWTLPKPLPKGLNNESSNVLFHISPDGKNALIYGNYDSLRTEGFYLFERNHNNFTNPKLQKIKNYVNHSKNFYGTINPASNVMIITLINEKSYGGEDLFITFKQDNNSWSEPINLGNIINSEFDEISPFIAYDNCHLYFSSNRKDGYGGFDLYVSERLDSSWTKWSEPLNLGDFINSKFNETGFSTTLFSDTAFIISSEIKLIPSNNDIRLYDTIDYKHGIYLTCIPEEIKPNPYLIVTGKIYEYKSEQLIPIKNKIRFEVLFSNSFHKNYEYYFSSNDDNYVLIIPWKEIANISLQAENYKSFTFQINTDSITKSQILFKDFILEPIKNEKPLLVLYYETDIYKLNLKQKQEIDFNLNFIDNKLSKRITIIGFADQYGSIEYNDTLSFKRAETVQKYLLNLGFDENNIKIIAKGKRESLNRDPALNRKVEIYIN